MQSFVKYFEKVNIVTIVTIYSDFQKSVKKNIYIEVFVLI